MKCKNCDATTELVGGYCPNCRDPLLKTIQNAQNAIGKTRDQYRHGTLEFVALEAAWEMTRAAWYAMNGSPREKRAPARAVITEFIAACNRRKAAPNG